MKKILYFIILNLFITNSSYALDFITPKFLEVKRENPHLDLHEKSEKFAGRILMLDITSCKNFECKLNLLKERYKILTNLDLEFDYKLYRDLFSSMFLYNQNCTLHNFPNDMSIDDFDYCQKDFDIYNSYQIKFSLNKFINYFLYKLNILYYETETYKKDQHLLDVIQKIQVHHFDDKYLYSVTNINKSKLKEINKIKELCVSSDASVNCLEEEILSIFERIIDPDKHPKKIIKENLMKLKKVIYLFVDNLYKNKNYDIKQKQEEIYKEFLFDVLLYNIFELQEFFIYLK